LEEVEDVRKKTIITDMLATEWELEAIAESKEVKT